MLLSYLQYSKARVRKQRERDERITKLPAVYHQSLSDADKTILNTPLSTLINNVQSGIWTPTNVLHAYGRKTLSVHAQTNCLTEVFIGDADVWASDVNANLTLKKTGPLAGVPVSLKDSIAVAGYDACIGYAAWVGRPVQRDSAIVRLLRDAGALLYVKTAIPTTLLSFESYSGVFGRCTNPHNSSFSPGGSTGGDAALIAAGGARVGLGTDIAGSVRVPAHYSGIYSVRSSVGRFPKSGNVSSNPGIEGVPSSTSPLARTLEDLETFWAAVFQMEPWKYDHSVLRIPWKPVTLPEGKVRFGVMWDDGVVPLSPACRRALQSVVDNLRRKGYEVFDFAPSDPYEGLKVASQLILADGGETVLGPLLPGEPNDPGMVSASFWLRLPCFLRNIYIWWVKYFRRDSIYAGLLKALYKKSVAEVYKLVAEREKYKALWHEAWNKSGMDFLLTAPNALPAVPHGGMKNGWKVCGYTFLFNLLDYTAGVQPITHVSASLDAMTKSTPVATNQIAKEAFAMYDARAMDGLPVGVQVVGRRLEEEKVLAGMRLIENIMKENGQGYELLEV
ncbi:amidase signature enzyme [Fomitiporia mediterranea MF3/22]|uniref:amidase signature enzyme n=1 Tax=Fomitiporia mediterranea (strain MF3/22) TaxID=694068 RepID=UPI00044087BC|nr:amidase signature enzyme [Fomitiporia mediterranea MF3/22]EJD05467.1 amidase signature enzyme [Fomitiporia mediterranea MF3/22]